MGSGQWAAGPVHDNLRGMRDKIAMGSEEEARAVLGVQDRHARLFRSAYGVAVTVRNGELHLSGEDDDVRTARRVVEEVLQRYRSVGHIDAAEVDLLVRAHGGGPVGSAAGAGSGEPILRRVGSKAAVGPRSPAQQEYVQAMQDHSLVFAIGPAGTGKTYLAVAMAVRMLRDGVVRKRPCLELGLPLTAGTDSEISSLACLFSFLAARNNEVVSADELK